MLTILEDERYIHEDLERLEQGIADRVRDDPNHIRNRLNRDHEVAQLLKQMQLQLQHLISSHDDPARSAAKELQKLDTADPFGQFYEHFEELREHHSRYPNEQAENSEQRYKPKHHGDSDGLMHCIVDTIFSGEEAYGRFFDLNTCHEAFLNLPNAKRLTYLQYLENFDNFTPGHGGIRRAEKLSDQYLQYVSQLVDYLTSFRKRTRPLDDTEKVLREFDQEFDKAWEADSVQGWTLDKPADASITTDEAAVWCDDCEKEFKNRNVYNGHLNGRKHIKAAELRKQRKADDGEQVPTRKGGAVSTTRIKERVIAEREHRVKRLASSMSTERSDTRVNTERKQGMTERERQQELENLLNVSEAPRSSAEEGGERGEDGEEKIYNPLKLPLAWDGKPIPFWLYRLHGLGVEFHCEICGNFVYMGRRAFDKHFGEPRHIYGLKCLGITNVTLFRDITKIEEALKLWDRLQQEQKKSKIDEGSIVQMEDGEGVYRPLPALYTVYVLRSSVRKASLYIGSTPNPQRRLKQHNGDSKGGARRTSSLRPWEMVALVSGFPSMISALKFEWALNNPHLSLHIPDESRLTVVKRKRWTRRRKLKRPSHTLLSVVSNLHLLIGVPSFVRWPLDLRFFAPDVHAAWEGWMAAPKSRDGSATKCPSPCRRGLRILTDFAQDAAPDQRTGAQALPLNYRPMRDYVQKAHDVVASNRQISCVHCGEMLKEGRGMHAMCPLDGCTAMGHLDCWSRHGLADDAEGNLIPDMFCCVSCGGEIRWSDMVRELSLRIRGQKEVERLLREAARKRKKEEKEKEKAERQSTKRTRRKKAEAAETEEEEEEGEVEVKVDEKGKRKRKKKVAVVETEDEEEDGESKAMRQPTKRTRKKEAAPLKTEVEEVEDSVFRSLPKKRQRKRKAEDTEVVSC
ncbi:hypothetical protein L249_3725 [Ophiocordyceps polyrhachis-furcata BCC 54312]|uniref:Uncharacterized protein n=1 Tax=Ophiocordyceps polyrhachis-furcata BCC 54312 TaxID=1330021 RepID=A0A367L4Q2_9HYPO|nr:hypothetical protein L249_3725 [Ophiocordyceps polyrhachis-furcata BCC 54312]